MKVRAVIDRIVDGKKAVLLLNPDEQELSISLDKLPVGSEQGSWLEVTLQDGEICSLVLLMEETEQRRQNIADKMNLLRLRGTSLRRKK